MSDETTHCCWIQVAQDQEIIEDCDELATEPRYLPDGRVWWLCSQHARQFDDEMELAVDMPPGET